MARSPWFEMPSPFEVETGRVLLLEPPDAKANELRAQLLEERYAKPFVIDDGVRRYLYFSVGLMQSAMLLTTPNELDLRYTRKMMAFLLFNPKPKRLLLIGLGGGSLVKFCHHRLPASHMTAVDLSPEVIAFRDAFLLPPDGPRLHILEADGADYLAQIDKGLDVLLVDAFDNTGVAPNLARREFFALARTKLSGSGMVVMNLTGDKDRYAGLIGAAMAEFNDRVILFSIPEDGNHVLMAFKDAAFAANWRAIHQRAKELRSRFGLDFPAYAQKIERADKLGLARREALRGR